MALNPEDYAAHLYLGTLLLQLDGNAQGAVAQFRLFLADDPPSDVVSQAASIRAPGLHRGRPATAVRSADGLTRQPECGCQLKYRTATSRPRTPHAATISTSDQSNGVPRKADSHPESEVVQWGNNPG